MRVVVLPGDGVGPEVIAQAVRVLQTVGGQSGLEIEVVPAAIGGAAISE
ncbi:MAG: isocitrate/isopropylmalate family dehydrogenase, partial [bacterium]